MTNQAFVYTISNKLFVDVMTFGEWLRQQINEQKLSNAEVARRAKVSPTYIGNLVRDFSPNKKDGKGRPSEDVVEEIAKAVGGNLDDARLAAGYAPQDISQDAHEIAAGIQIIFQNGAKLTKKQKEEIRQTAAVIARGVMASGSDAEKEGK